MANIEQLPPIEAAFLLGRYADYPVSVIPPPPDEDLPSVQDVADAVVRLIDIPLYQQESDHRVLSQLLSNMLAS